MAASLWAGTVRGPLVVNDRWPQCTDLNSWTRDVMRIEGLTQASDTAQAKAFFRWLRLFSRMATGGMIQAYEGEWGREQYVLDAHKNLFVYGWGYCDTTSRIAEAAWTQFKQDRDAAERVCVMHDNGGYHTMFRLRLDGRWGAFDPRYGYYLVDRDAPDAAIVDWDQVGRRIVINRGYQHRSRPFFEFFGLEWERALLLKPVYFRNEEAWIAAGKPAESVFGNRQYQVGTRYHDMDFELPPHTTIERFWDNTARKFYVPGGVHTQKEEAFLPSGRFYRITESMLDGNWPQHDPNHILARNELATVPTNEGYNSQVAGGRTIGQSWGRITSDAALEAGRTFDFYSPYVLVDGSLNSARPLEVRVLKAKPQHAGQPDVWGEWRKLMPRAGVIALDSISGLYRLQIRGSAGPIKLTLHFENGIMTLPRLFDGDNRIQVKLRDASQLATRIHVTYRYATAGGEQRHEQVLARADFQGNTAAYRIRVTGLVRNLSVAIRAE